MQPLHATRRMDRRSFLGALAAAGLSGLALPGSAAAELRSAADRRLERIGVQLYTLRDRMQDDPEGVLRAVADLGYHEVETAGYAGLAPAQFRALLDRFGLTSPAGHIPIGELRDDLQATLRNAHTVGQRWAVVPSLPEADQTSEGFRRVAEELNHFGQAAQELGMRVGYHNHAFEFQRFDDGRTGYDLLLAETDPALVDMELDLFWAIHAGQDPIQLIRRHPGRFVLSHVKDMADIGGEQRMEEVGEGEIDFARIFAVAQPAGMQHFFVEHDAPEDSLASIRSSIQHLRRLDF